jgi:hypothetical protein
MQNVKTSFLRFASAAAALLVLAGAKGNGCGGEEPPEPPPEPCPAGHHLEAVCDAVCGFDEEPGAMPCESLQCVETCVPDDGCPAGTYPQWLCYDVLAPDCTDPTDDCGGGCFLECIPVDACGPGYHEEWICDGSIGGPDLGAPEPCSPICVPDGCPPGTIEQTICYDQDHDHGGGVPEEPCFTECVPEVSCPPGTHPEEICEHDAFCGEPVCQIVCVDDCHHECDPDLICGEAITCSDGLLYPTTCGPANCDTPIGVCPSGCDPTLACPEVITCVDGVLYPTGCGPANCDPPIGAC